MPRLFFGVKPPERVRGEIHDAFYVPLQKHGKGFGLVDPTTWHITTHFVGNVTSRAGERIVETFRRTPLPFVENSAVQLGGENPVHHFGKEVLFLHVNDAQGTLLALHEWCKKVAPVALTHAHYRPHLTLARNPKGVPLDTLLQKLNEKPHTSTFRPAELILFDSRPEKGKTIHHPLAKKRIPSRKIAENP